MPFSAYGPATEVVAVQVLIGARGHLHVAQGEHAAARSLPRFHAREPMKMKRDEDKQGEWTIVSSSKVMPRRLTTRGGRLLVIFWGDGGNSESSRFSGFGTTPSRSIGSAIASRIDAPSFRKTYSVLDPDVGEVDRAAVVLEADRAFGGNAGKLGVFDDTRAVERDGQAVALEGDHRAVPLAERFVGFGFRGDAGFDFGRHFRRRCGSHKPRRIRRPVP